MAHCPSCGAYPGSDHHDACTVRARGLRNRDRSESIQKLIDENQQLQARLAEAREDWAREFEKRGTEVASAARETAILAAALMRLRDEGDQLYPYQIREIASNALAKVI